MSEKTSSPADADLPAGHKVGEYLIEEKIGEGGYGSVFRATHPLIGKRVAIKVLLRKYSEDPEHVSRFVAEARAVNQIRHRSIIDIFAFGQLDDGRHYYVMELLDGETLEAFIARAGPCPLETAVPILRDVARALDAAHANGIAHRDLKPENIFLVHEDEDSMFPKLLDFGIAKLMSAEETKHKTRTGASLGTPYYMSPEQCRGVNVDHRTDIYSFGCVAYQLLTGKVPFDAESHMAVMFQHTSEEPTPPSKIVELPEGVDEALAWMMKKDPGERPTDLAAAIASIERSAGIEPEPPRRSSRPFIPIPTPRPTPSPAALLAAANKITITPSGGTPSASLPATSERPVVRSPRTQWIAAGLVVVVAALALVLVVQQRDEPKAPVTAPIALGSDDADAQATAMPTADAEPAGSSVAAAPAGSPELVTIRVDGVPEGTEAFSPMGPLGRVPGTIQLLKGETEIQLTFTAPGYRTATHRLTPLTDATISVAMPKQPVAASGKRPGKRPGKPTKPTEPTPPDTGSGSAVEPDPYSRK